jgi:hypothetical protein
MGDRKVEKSTEYFMELKHQVDSYLEDLSYLSQVMKLSVSYWKEISGKDCVALARESGIWSTYVEPESGKQKVREMNLYLSLSTMPLQRTRWRKVMRTARFVHDLLPEADRRRVQLQELRNQIEERHQTRGSR